VPHEHDQAETHPTSHIRHTETITNRKHNPSLRYLAAGDMFGSGGPTPYFKPSPEAIAELTSLLAPGDNRR
jgi:hypothetical protein